MSIGTRVLTPNNIEGVIIGQEKGFWVVEFSNKKTNTYPTKKLRIK